MPQEPLNPNPIVDLAMRMRARRGLEQAVEESAQQVAPGRGVALEERLRAFADGLAGGIRKLNAILGQKNGVTLVRLERPFRVTLRFREKRVSLKPLDDGQHVRLTGSGWEGEYGFEPSTNALFPRAWFEPPSSAPAARDQEPLTPSSMLRELTREAMLPPPPPPEIGPLPF